MVSEYAQAAGEPSRLTCITRAMSTPCTSRERRGGRTIREDCKGSKAQIACFWWLAPFSPARAGGNHA